MMRISFFREGLATNNPTAFHASMSLPASRHNRVQELLVGLILFLFTGGVAQALQLQNAPVADPQVATTAVTASSAAPPAVVSKNEFSSLIVAGYRPASTASGIDADADPADSSRPAANTAAVTLKTLAWLFGIGIIGMGTVGRRRRK
ncbi:MAG: hypothetical protein RQ736_05930 [Thiogranum sp.]|nr:hypothetical protein [Thiogranum sp.]